MLYLVKIISLCYLYYVVTCCVQFPNLFLKQLCMHEVRYTFFSVILKDNCWVKIHASFPFQKRKNLKKRHEDS